MEEEEQQGEEEKEVAMWNTFANEGDKVIAETPTKKLSSSTMRGKQKFSPHFLSLSLYISWSLSVAPGFYSVRGPMHAYKSSCPSVLMCVCRSVMMMMRIML